MVLWYSYLNKPDEANREKQELFDLVGIHDDRILFPQIGACGHVVWWVTEFAQENFGCGMG